MSLQVIERYLTNNRCYQAGASREPHGIQIHSIGTGQGTAESVASYWNQPSVAACVTYVVDADIPGKVLQLLPEWMRSWADAGWGKPGADHHRTVRIRLHFLHRRGLLYSERFEEI